MVGDVLVDERRVRTGEPQPIAIGNTGEKLLGQRWSVVGAMRLGAEQRYLSLMPMSTKRFGAADPGERGPDDDYPRLHHARTALILRR